MTPRIVRLLVADKLIHDTVASWLLAAGWRNWSAPERTASVTTGTLTPWLSAWARTRTDPAGLHLGDALDRWLFEGKLADLRLGFYDEVHATPELLPWLLSLEKGRIEAAQLTEVERISAPYLHDARLSRPQRLRQGGTTGVRREAAAARCCPGPPARGLSARTAPWDRMSPKQ
ncbi:hypothetical protein [Streptomyces luteireticuli]|uniref:hypothetical protein n=1 Tax=Streptomyces luteireticuli TaxID=173858 RepID=UPI003557F110